VPRFLTRTVAAVTDERDGLQRVELDDGERAYVLTALVGPVEVGDDVVVNTTAVELGLGTGGWHVVHWNLSRRVWDAPGGGHVMKMRYTSLQADIGVAEETHGDVPVDLGGLPVVVCGLHSQVACVAVVVRALRPEWRVAYVMTDAASLPIALSELVAAMRSAGLVDVTVTTGQSFGGDLEAVNVASGLAVTRHVASADVAIVAMGPGAVGTGTTLGFGALETAGVLDTAAWLGATPIACVRYSEADGRPRHHGVSHHTLTVLARAARPVVVALPDGPYGESICTALAAAGVDARHRLFTVPVPDVAALFAAAGLEVESMGRRPADDPAFFTTAGAAGATAAVIANEAGTVHW
jgi:Protein of unknown function (DUF3866)